MKLRLLFSFIVVISVAQKLNAKELVVYTSRKEHLVKDIFEQYTKETGVVIKYKTGKAAALIQTLKAEGKNTPADIFMTVDAGNLSFAASENLLTPITSKVLNKNVPRHLKDLKGRWYGLSKRARTIVYNTKKVKKAELKSYEDLASKKWKNRICLRTSKKVYNQSLVAMLIFEQGFDRARDIVGKWVNNTVEIFSNDTGVLKAVASGQCDVGIVNTYYYGRLIKKDGTLPIKLFWPNQNKSYGVHINVSGAGIVKNSHNKKEAQKFLEWLSGRSAQKSFAQVNLEYPVNAWVKNSPETISWGKFKENTSFNLTKAGHLQKDAIRLMQEVKYK
jgi:iron(III) transport system substrate-binding protein